MSNLDRRGFLKILAGAAIAAPSVATVIAEAIKPRVAYDFGADLGTRVTFYDSITGFSYLTPNASGDYLGLSRAAQLEINAIQAIELEQYAHAIPDVLYAGSPLYDRLKGGKLRGSLDRAPGSGYPFARNLEGMTLSGFRVPSRKGTFAQLADGELLGYGNGRSIAASVENEWAELRIDELSVPENLSIMRLELESNLKDFQDGLARQIVTLDRKRNEMNVSPWVKAEPHHIAVSPRGSVWITDLTAPAPPPIDTHLDRFAGSLESFARKSEIALDRSAANVGTIERTIDGVAGAARRILGAIFA